MLLTGVALAEGERHKAVSGTEWSYHNFPFTYFPTHINSGKCFPHFRKHEWRLREYNAVVLLYCLNLAKLKLPFPAFPSLGGSWLGLAAEDMSVRSGK